MTDGELLTLAEIAQQLGMNPSSVRLWVYQEWLPATKMGRSWVVRREDLEQLLTERPDLGHPDRDPRDTRRPKSNDARAAAFDIAGAINQLVGRRQ
jgi:excisionase family DNA binding protein